MEPMEIKEVITKYIEKLGKNTNIRTNNRGSVVQNNSDPIQTGAVTQRDYIIGPILGKETEMAIKEVERKKAIGLDDIPNEFIIEGGPVLRECLLLMFNIILKNRGNTTKLERRENKIIT